MSYFLFVLSKRVYSSRILDVVLHSPLQNTSTGGHLLVICYRLLVISDRFLVFGDRLLVIGDRLLVITLIIFW